MADHRIIGCEGRGFPEHENRNVTLTARTVHTRHFDEGAHVFRIFHEHGTRLCQSC